MPENNLPNHVAIIPDGNRRWAKERGLPSFAGHQQGMERASEIARYARKLGISTATFWGLSTENWLKRPEEEVSYLINKIFMLAMDRFADEAEKEGVRITHLGRKDRLPKHFIERLTALEAETKNNDKYFLNLGFDYGGRDEILRAMNRWRNEGGGELSEEIFSNLLDTGDQPYPSPDLIIRTSGEMRMSGFLPWQSDYAELYFEKSYLPDFTTEKFDQALADYAIRKRRYGA